MTYHMEQVPLRKASSGETGRITFPYKLLSALNEDTGLLKWQKDGRSFLVNEDRFEKLVMTTHPGFLQIPSFTNFRRQLRWYCFDWNYLNEFGDFEFSHPNFIRGRLDLLEGVVTQKKSTRQPRRIQSSPACFQTPDPVAREFEAFSPRQDSQEKRGGPECRMSLRDRVLQRASASETMVPSVRKRRRMRAADRPCLPAATLPPLPSCPSTVEENPELWWYYCAVFGQPDQITDIYLNQVEDMPTKKRLVDIPVCFHDEPRFDAAIFDIVERDSGSWCLEGRRFAELASNT